jgi:hypothetical protein
VQRGVPGPLAALLREGPVSPAALRGSPTRLRPLLLGSRAFLHPCSHPDGGDLGTPMTDAQIVAGAEGQSVQMAVSNAMVRLLQGAVRVRTDKGPNELRGAGRAALHAGGQPDPRRASLREMGEFQRLRDVRLFFQHATEDKFREALSESPAARSTRAPAAWTSTRTSPARSSI